MSATAGTVPRSAAALSVRATVTYAPRMDHGPEDSALMLRYRDGDAAAFETLYRRHNDALFRYLLRMCRHRDAAEDVFQDVWSKIIRARGQYRPTARFTTYLYRVAHNCFIDHLRRNRRHLAADNADEPDSQAHDGDGPEWGAEKLLARQRLESALKMLPDEQRDVFLLHEEAGLSLDQIAAVTDCNRETAKSRLRYALRKLRAALDEVAETT